MGISHTFINYIITFCLIILLEFIFSIDILDREDTYCNENNISDLICVPVSIIVHFFSFLKKKTLFIQNYIQNSLIILE